MYSPYHYIGLDIHKRTVAYCEKRADGKLIASGSFRTTLTGITTWLKERNHPWLGGMEATLFTGHLYDKLAPHAVELLVGHPASLRAIVAGKHKSDIIDATILANLLRADLFPTCHVAPPHVRELRRILRYRNFLLRECVRMKNKTTGLLMETGVEYDSRRIHSQKYFDAFIDQLDEVPPSVRELLSTTRSSLEFFQESQVRLLKALTNHKDLKERVQRLRTIPGVGEVMALTWALEIDDPTRFSNLKHVVSYCGLCSGQNESAGKSKNGPLSKQRNPHLQAKLIEVAKLAPGYNAQLKALHTRTLARNPVRNRATCTVARKLVAYLYAVDKSGNPFEERPVA